MEKKELLSDTIIVNVTKLMRKELQAKADQFGVTVSAVTRAALDKGLPKVTKLATPQRKAEKPFARGVKKATKAKKTK